MLNLIMSLKIIDLIDSKALELIKSLGRHYNRITEWCGMLIIPRVLLKEN